MYNFSRIVLNTKSGSDLTISDIHTLLASYVTVWLKGSVQELIPSHAGKDSVLEAYQVTGSVNTENHMVIQDITSWMDSAALPISIVGLIRSVRLHSISTG